MKLFHLLLLGMALFIAGCGGDDNTADNGDPTQRIYVLAAASGNAGAASAGLDVTVTLSGVEPEVDWYSDRPDRLTGDAKTQAFIDADWQQVYGGVAPNALLQFHVAGDVHALFGSVRDVAYDGNARSLRFTLHVAKASDAFSASAGGFTRPVLTLLNNLQPPAEGSSFALAAARTALAKDSAGNWRLELEGVDPNVLWMNNAPARSADVESLGQFVNLWSERFSAVLPNASVAGDPGDGDYDIMPLTLSDPRYDVASGRLSFAATLLAGPGVPDAGTVLSNAVLFVDAGARGIPSEVFAQNWRGVAYSAIPAKFLAPPTGAFFDSDTTAEAFQALWGSKNGCGRNDLEAMAAQGINLVRLYDYNYQRGSDKWETGGNGHIAFLDKAQSLGIKVIIPVSNYNFKNRDRENRPWDNIDNTVTQIVASVKKNGAIHPAVHSFSIGNELDLNQDGETSATLIPKAVRVAKLLHQLAPDHYMTVPVSNGDEKKFYNLLRDQLPADLYANRFYNAVQTFKLKTGDDLKNNILQAYDDLKLGVPLVITELGTNSKAIGSVDAKVDAVVGQASAVREYMDANPQSLVKGFAIFEWQNANWKRDSKPDNTESTFGIHAYDGTLCQSKTGTFGMWNAETQVWADFHQDETYDVDKLAPLTSAAHPEGLLTALSKYFK
ncbi:hypothetical protein ACFOHU_07245 [Ottowia pentelensis]|uniref:Uncharacterized protein n=1 Tax=Ottowia pentelensis TaxID=511108 RepID=A0ABV6PX79_9BURK